MSFKPLKMLLLPAAIALVSAPLYAEENEARLTNVVVSAAGYEQKLTEAPASISIIGEAELRSRPYLTLLDAVRELEGVDVGETNDKTGQGSISIRGMGSDYTLVLIDGKRQNNHGNIYPNNFGGNQFSNMPPLEAIERIEVIRGPASTLYGADAMGGVINIITKPIRDSWGGSISHSRTFQTDDSFGNDITTDAYFSGPLIENTLGMAIRGSVYNRLESNPVFNDVVDPNGEKHSRALGFGSGGKTVDNENTSIGASLVWTPTSKQKIAFDIDSYKQQYDNSPLIDDQGKLGYPLGTVDSIDTIWAETGSCEGAEGKDEQKCTAAGGTWETQVTPRTGYAADQEFTRETMAITHEGEWSFGSSFVSLQQVKTNNTGRTLPFTVAERQKLQEMFDGTGAYLNMSEKDRKTAAEEAFLPRPARTMESQQYVLDAKLDVPFELLGQHTAVVGGQVIRGELSDDVFGLENSNAGQVQEHNMWSLFAEDTWYVLEPVAVTAGVRYDNHELFGSHVSPHLYGVYNITHNWTLKGGVSTGFKTPNTTDLYDGVVGFGGQGTMPLYGNSDLKPEISTSNEVALYWQHPVERHGFNVTVFQNKFKDKITSQPCGGTTGIACTAVGDYQNLGYTNSNKALNIDEVVLEGVEVAGRIQLTDSIGWRSNYTYTDSEQKSGIYEGYPLNGTAKHMHNSTLDWQMRDNLNLFLTMETRAKRFRGFGRGNVLNAGKDGTEYFKSYDVFHLGMSWQLSEQVTLNGRINNLLDTDFTSYKVDFVDVNGNGNYNDKGDITYYDDYNNKDKRRNVWLSMNVVF